MSNYPYTNTHNLNLDWIVKIVKDFQENYTGINAALTSAIEQINELNEESKQELTALKDQLLVALETASNLHLAEMDTSKTEALASIERSYSDAITKINNLITTLPSDYRETVGKLAIIGNILQNNTVVAPMLQGNYSGGVYNSSDTYTATSLMQIGPSGLQLAITVPEPFKISAVRYFTGYTESGNNITYTGQTVITPSNNNEVVVTFPNNAIAFNAEFQYTTPETTIDPLDVKPSFVWASDVTNMHNVIDSLLIKDDYSLEWAQGSISSNTGRDSSSTTRVRSNYIAVEKGLGVEIEIPAGYKIYVHGYSDTSGNGHVSGGAFIEGEQVLTQVPALGDYIRLVLANITDASITPADVPAGLKLYRNFATDATLSMDGKPADAKATGDALAARLWWTSYDGGTMLRNQSGNTICRIGSLANMEDAPADITGTNLYAWLITAGATNKLQVLFISRFQKIYSRFYTASSNSWSAWGTSDDGNIPVYVAIGASTTIGAIHHFDGNPTTLDNTYNYPAYVANVLHLRPYNLGQGTTGFIARGTNGNTPNFMDTIYANDEILQNAELVSLVFGYGNDQSAGLPIGVYDDFYPYDEEGYHPEGTAGITTMINKGATLFGCLNWCIKWINEKYPRAHLALVYGAPSGNADKVVTKTENPLGEGVNQAPYKLTFAGTEPGQISTELSKLQAALNIPMYDAIHGDGLPFSYYQTFAKDDDGYYSLFSTVGNEFSPASWAWNSHPNSDGYKMYARFMAGVIVGLFKH